MQCEVADRQCGIVTNWSLTQPLFTTVIFAINIPLVSMDIILILKYSLMIPVRSWRVVVNLIIVLIWTTRFCPTLIRTMDIWSCDTWIIYVIGTKRGHVVYFIKWKDWDRQIMRYLTCILNKYTQYISMQIKYRSQRALTETLHCASDREL